jgi:hypothetical protein
MMVYIGWGVTYWHSIYGDLILGRAGVYLEGYVWHTYTLMVKISSSPPARFTLFPFISAIR